MLFCPDASVLVGEKGSLRRGNGSFVFLLILPVETRVADLLGDLRSIAGEGLLKAFHALHHTQTSGSKRQGPLCRVCQLPKEVEKLMC